VAGKIFINYRRGDDPQAAGRLFDRLQDVFKPEQLFLDVDNIAPGLDFGRVLDERVAECDVVLAVIGKSWIGARDAGGNRRLDDPDDFVRIEITSALTQGKRVIPVLVGDAQMPRAEELPEVMRPLVRRNAVRLTHERFRADTAGLVKSLQQVLGDIEEHRQAQAEATQQARAEEVRARQEAERLQQEATAKQRALEERELAEAKRVGTALAFDTFLAVHPESGFADEAKRLRAALQTREDAYHRAAASTDQVLLKSFLATYKKGADTDQIRARLRDLEPRQASALSLPTIAVVALAIAVLGGGAYFWMQSKGTPPSNQQASVAPAVSEPPSNRQGSVAPTVSPPPAKPSIAPAPSALPATTSVPPAITAPKPPPVSAPELTVSKPPPAPTPAPEVTAPKSVPPPSSEANASPSSAAVPVVQLPPPAPITAATVTAPDPRELTRSLQTELKRVGCFLGEVNGDFDDATKAAWHRFIKLTSLDMPDDLSPDAINAVRGTTKRVCPAICGRGEHSESGTCVADEPPPKHAAKTAPVPAAPAPSAPAAPKSTGYCQPMAHGEMITNAGAICH
jgi:hypothetical protein